MNLITPKNLLIPFFILMYNICYSQDTLYLDKDFNPTDKISASHFKVVNSVPNGFEVNTYSSNWQLNSKETFQEKTLKTLSGPAINYYENGKKDFEGNYVNGKRDGEWRFYFPSGQISAIVKFENDHFTTGNYFESDGKPLDSLRNDHAPSFKGGIAALVNYIKNNLHYPGNYNIHRKVMVRFIIMRDGHVADVHVSNPLNDILDQESVRVISSMPDWNPGVQFNRPVNVHYQIPLSF